MNELTRWILPLASLLILLPFQSGCGLLLGNVRPVDEKSYQYGVADLSKESPTVWRKLNPNEEGADAQDPETSVTEVPDVAFQSSQTAAIISINSSCRPSVETESKDLTSLTDLLLLGMGDRSKRTEKTLTLQNTPALQTNAEGKMNGKEIALRTIVFRRGTCVYDLLYMASPANFSKNEPDFNHFVASLRLK